MSSHGKAAQQHILARRDKAKNLAARLAKMFNMMESSPPFQNHRRVVLCMPTLCHACISYMIDLERWSPFHCITIPDNHKRAAFIFKWISKLRPVQLLSSIGTSVSEYEMAANSYFAMLAALGELRVNMMDFAASPAAKSVMYTSMYRDILPESWGITFYLLEKAYPEVKNHSNAEDTSNPPLAFFVP